MHKRNLKDLNLLDDFLLNAVVTYPGIGETFCRILLGIIFQRQFGKLVIVIMITPFDPFGLNRMVYTIRNLCEEVPDMPYDDGARTLFLYTKGSEGNPSKELQQLLNYMETTTQENAKNEELRTIQKMVETVKQSEEVSISYMKIMEREEMLINEGISRGISQGKSIGETQKLIQQVCRKIQKGKSAPVIAEELEEPIEVVEKICVAIEKCGSDMDVEMIYKVLNGADQI